MANNSDWNVHIPARKKCTTAKQEVVRVSADAYNALNLLVSSMIRF